MQNLEQNNHQFWTLIISSYNPWHAYEVIFHDILHGPLPQQLQL